MSAQLDTASCAILHYQRESKDPSAEFIAKVDLIFAVGFDDLLGGGAKPQRRPGLTPQIAQLTERLSRLPRSQQKLVAAMLEGVLQKAG